MYEKVNLRDYSIGGIIVGIMCFIIAVILSLTGGTKLIVYASGWGKAANLAFLFSIACSLLPKNKKSADKEK